MGKLSSRPLIQDCLAEYIASEGNKGVCAQPCLVDTCTLLLRTDPEYGAIPVAGECAVELAFTKEMAEDDDLDDDFRDPNGLDFIPLEDVEDEI